MSDNGLRELREQDHRAELIAAEGRWYAEQEHRQACADAIGAMATIVGFLRLESHQYAEYLTPVLDRLRDCDLARQKLDKREARPHA